MGFSRLKLWLTSRLPTVQQLAAVYSVIVLIVYGWTIYWYLWKLPSWLYFMTLGEMLVAFSYAMVVNILESLLVLLLPVLLCFLLPRLWFREQFVARGAMLVIPSLVALMKYLTVITRLQALPPGLGWMTALVTIGIAFLVFLTGRIVFLRKVMEEIANRATIFLYIFMPISLVSILVVAARNLMRL